MSDRRAPRNLNDCRKRSVKQRHFGVLCRVTEIPCYEELARALSEDTAERLFRQQFARLNQEIDANVRDGSRLCIKDWEGVH
jgi:hypothetical protein